MNIQCKRVYDPAEDSDGYRVLVDRLWPRGIKKQISCSMSGSRSSPFNRTAQSLSRGNDRFSAFY